MSPKSLNETEPAALIGTIAAALGSLALTGADVNTLQSIGTALGIAGTQGVLTRQAVYSPKTAKELASSQTPTADLAGLLSGSTGLARTREPALAIGVVSLLGGFLVQFFSGVDMTEALVAATGIAGAQGVATRGRVYSPASARGIAATNVIATNFSATEVAAAEALPELRSAAA